jgi:hypothetical protein
MLGSSITRHYDDIKTYLGNSVNVAVATAIAARQYEKAVEWMEKGRQLSGVKS